MMASLDRLAATTATATYGADVTKTIRGWIIALLILLAFLGVAGVLIAGLGE